MGPNDLDYAGVRLRFINSRLVEDEDAQEHGHGAHEHHHPRPRHGHGHRRRHEDVDSISDHDSRDRRKGHMIRDTPVFSKNESATNFELFFDLWFVANLNVFTTVHEIFGKAELASYIGYIVLLWTTWLMVTIYDVRFSADSVVARIGRAVHLAVMVGFAEFGTSFDPDDQVKAIFQTLSLFLAVSRLTLAMQYGVVAFQIRKYANGRRAMVITAVLHLIAAAVYFGVSFRYEDGKNSRGYIMWYITGIVEMALHLILSNLSPVLSFKGTHFGERLNLLTLIILGEGCIILAKNITLLVKDTFLKETDIKWSGSLVVAVICAAGLVYIIFQIYFDWIHEGHHNAMCESHQVWWASVHLPFHVALVLFLEGAIQFVSWRRILQTVQSALRKLEGSLTHLTSPTTEEVTDALSSTIYPFLEQYKPPDAYETYKDVREILEHVSEIDDSFWTESNYTLANPVYQEFTDDVHSLFSTMASAIYYAFGIEQPEDEEPEQNGQMNYIEQNATEAVSKRFGLIFMYTFACAGIVLMILTIMHTLAKRQGWTPFNVARTMICGLVAIGLSLTCIVAANPQQRDNFMGSAWMLPTITLSYLFVLILTHVRHPRRRWALGRYADSVIGPRGGPDEYREVSMKEKGRARESRSRRPPKERRGVRETVYNGSTSPSDEDRRRATHRSGDKRGNYSGPPRHQIYDQSRHRRGEETVPPDRAFEDRRDHGPWSGSRPPPLPPRNPGHPSQPQSRSRSHSQGEHLRRGDETNFGVYDERRINLLADDIERMIPPSPPTRTGHQRGY